MDNLTLQEIREERFYTIIDDMNPEELAQYALEFIFADDEQRRRFVAEFLADFDDDDDYKDDDEEDEE